MTNILQKVQIYLDKASKSPVKFSKQRADKFHIRMSNAGRPTCQLQMEAKNVKGDGQSYNVKMRNTFGDMVEALAVFILKSSGVNITGEQKPVSYKFNGGSIDGTYDVKIKENQEKIWDIKSASPYSFEHKFGEKGGFMELVKEDSFGYVPQGYLYSESEKVPFGGWIVINKSTGEWTVCETPLVDDEYKKEAIEKAHINYKTIKDDKPFKRCYTEIDETYRKKLTGNKVLGTVCSYCPYKVPCWGNNLQLLPQQQSQGKNPKWVWYTEVNNPREDNDYNKKS